MHLVFTYTASFMVTFLFLDMVRWIAEKNMGSKLGATCVILLIWHDAKYRKIRFTVLLLIILLGFSFGLYLILSQQAQSGLLGVFTALVSWLLAGMILDRWR